MKKDTKTEKAHIEIGSFIGSFKCTFENPTLKTVFIILMVLSCVVTVVLSLK